jgi:hypothetical protein
METATPYLLLSALLAAVGGPLLTQAGKEWRWVDRWSTAINAVLGQLCAVIVWAVWGDGDRAMLGSLLIVAAGGSTAGGVGYTAIKRAGQAVRGKRQDRDAQTLSEMRRMTRRPKRQWPKPPPGGTPGLVLAVLLLAAPAAAQDLPRPLAPGDLVYYCSGDLRCNPGRVRDTRSVPAAPCDPWADGVFRTATERCGDGRCEIPETPETCAVDCEGRTPVRSDLACWRHRYAYPKPSGWGLGNWCGQHGGECRAVGAAWRALVGGTGVPACEAPGATGRAACDAHVTAGATLGCHMLSCGWASCPPHEVRTCPTSGPCPTGWTCPPLLDLPPERWRGADVPGGGIVQYYPTADPRAVCSYWFSPRALYVNTARPACFAGLPADCQRFEDLRLACWAPPEPPPPLCGDGTCEPSEVCPADCTPAPDPTCPPCPPVDPVAEALLEAVRAVPGVCP